MITTTTSLTRAAGLAAAAAGAIFIGVQINHPYLDSASISTTDVEIRDNVKVLMAVLALVGISGMYLSQTRRNGRVGLVGYAVLAAGYLSILCTSFVAAYVLPVLAGVNPDYVDDVTAVATGRSADGDIGILNTVFQVQGFAYLAGGLIFGIALYRARVLARWAAALLALGGLVSAALTAMPDAFYRFLAFPNGIAMIALGISLWRTAGQTQPASSAADRPIVTAAAR
jgi:hypothetical protein